MIILHYHLFKNAGTSFDAMLSANFGARWIEQEFEIEKGKSNAAEVTAFIEAHRDIAALSSHTALMPVPVIPGIEIFPVIFIRQPLLRLRSAYSFEKKQDSDSFGSKLAKDNDFAGYVRVLLDMPGPNQARNFQSARLAQFELDTALPSLDRARAAWNGLPFVGLVEQYDRSIQRLTTLLRPMLPDFEPLVVRKNVTAGEARTIDEQLQAIRAELGEDLYRDLVSANADDIVIFRLVSGFYSALGAHAA